MFKDIKNTATSTSTLGLWLASTTVLVLLAPAVYFILFNFTSLALVLQPGYPLPVIELSRQGLISISAVKILPAKLVIDTFFWYSVAVISVYGYRRWKTRA